MVSSGVVILYSGGAEVCKRKATYRSVLSFKPGQSKTGQSKLGGESWAESASGDLV